MQSLCFFFNDMPPASSLRLKFKRGLMVLKMLSLLALVLDLGGGLSPRRRTLTRLMLFLLILVIVVHLSGPRYKVVLGINAFKLIRKLAGFQSLLAYWRCCYCGPWQLSVYS